MKRVTSEAKRVTSEACYERSVLRAKRSELRAKRSELRAKRSELRAKRSELRASYERTEYKSAGGTGGAVRPPDNFFEFRTPESESERNLTNYFIIFWLLFVTFLLRIFWKIFFRIIYLISFRYLKIIMKQSTILLLYYFYEQNISPCGPLDLGPPHLTRFFLENFSVFSVFWGTF